MTFGTAKWHTPITTRFGWVSHIQKVLNAVESLKNLTSNLTFDSQIECMVGKATLCNHLGLEERVTNPLELIYIDSFSP
jgi:hypothetical protein